MKSYIFWVLNKMPLFSICDYPQPGADLFADLFFNFQCYLSLLSSFHPVYCMSKSLVKFPMYTHFCRKRTRLLGYLVESNAIKGKVLLNMQIARLNSHGVRG